jgi:hypothetical protein
VESAKLDFGLHPAQLKVFASKARFVVVAAGRRFGKSDLAAKRSIVKAFDARNVQKKPVWLVGPVQPQMKQIYWDMLLRLTEPVRKSFHINDGNITLINDVQIGLRGADRPDNMRGTGLWDVTLDEFADTKPQTWESILRPALSDVKGSAMFIGSPKGRNHFYHLCQAAQADTTGEWEYFHFTTLDNPFIDPVEVEAARRTMSSSMFRQEYMASFETGGSDMMKLEWLKYSDEEPKEGVFFVAVDLAGFTQDDGGPKSLYSALDRTSIAIVKIDQVTGKWWVKRIEAGRWGVEETARRIVAAIVEVRPVAFGIEKGALYRAVAPYLEKLAAKKNVPIRARQLSHDNLNKTNRVVWALQGRFEHGNIVLCPGDWTRDFEDEYLHFPSKLVKDDMIDSLAYIDQLVKDYVFGDFAEEVEGTYWKPLDHRVGF